MTYGTAQDLYLQVKKTSLTDLRNDFFRLCIDYSRLRAQWCLWNREERKEKDRLRTATHDALISAANSLSRGMAGRGEDIRWRSELGQDRRVIGDFACFVSCILGLEGR